ncbi:MAG: translocation/assembly module TamB domain-containing protein [Zavarzinia sp.]|nr:translocation/assembly module TamB domain-containing protein [Zavarzinia sp.]
MKPSLSRTLKWTGIGLGAPLVVIALAIAALQVPAVQSRLAAFISDQVSSPEMTIRLDGLSGGLPFGPALARIEVSDPVGPWLTVENARVSIDPYALIGGRIHVREIVASRLVLDRLPMAGAEPPPSEEPTSDFSLPRLPAGLALDRLSVPEIVLGAALAGAETRFALGGRLGVDGVGIAGASLSLQPVAGADSTRLTLDVRHEPQGDHLALDVRLDEPAHGPISRIAGLASDEPLHVALTGQGPLTGFEADLKLAALGARLDGRLSLARDGAAINASLRGRALPGPLVPADYSALVGDGIGIDLALSVGGETVDVWRLGLVLRGVVLDALGQLKGGADASLSARIDVRPDAPLPELATLPVALRPSLIELEGVADLSVGGADITRLHVAAPGAEVEGKATLADGFASLKAEVGARLADLAQVPEAGLAGAGTLAITAEGRLTPLDIGFTADVAGENIAGDADLPRLLGPAPRVSLAGRYADGGALVLDRLSAEAAVASLRARGSFDPAAETLSAEVAGKASDLGRLGLEGLAGSVDLAGTVQGPVMKPLLDLTLTGAGVSAGGIAFGDPRLVLKAVPDAAGTSAGRLDVETGGTYPTRLGADVAFDGVTARVTGLSGQVLGVDLAGDIAYASDSGLAEGRVKAVVPRLATLSPVAGMPLAGSARVELALAPRDKGQGADVTAELRNASAAGATLARLDLKAALDDLLGAGKGRATVEATGLASGDATIDRLTAKADLASFADIGFTVAAAGGVPAPVKLDIEGRFENFDTPRITAKSLTGTLAETDFGLRKPLTVTLGAETAVKGLDLAFGKARLVGDVTIGNAPSGKLRLNGFDFADVAALVPAGSLPGGLLDASLDISGNRGRLDLAAKGLTPPEGLLDVAAADMPKPDLEASIAWQGRKADVDLAVTGIREATIKANGSVPIRIEGGIPLPDQKGALDLAVRIDANLRRLAPLLPLGDNRIAGRLAVDATIKGTPAAPEPVGRLTLEKGRVTNGLSGFELRDLALAVAFTGTSATIESLKGTDGEGGTIAGSGSARQLADGDFAIDGQVTARSLRFTRLDLATTDGDVDIALAGTATAPEVKGTVTIRHGNVEISAKVPPSVAVVEVRDPAAPGTPPTPLALPPDKDAPPPRVGSLDLAIHAPGQFFVRGRGLDSEWRGTIRVTGALTAPDLSGGFEVVRGTFTLAGRPFSISEGSLTFPSGLAAAPQLNIVATAPADDVTAKVTVTGPANALKIQLSSEPSLPNDEVLSRVLFGRSVSNLTASQAVRLGQTALELSGQGGGDFLGKVRDTLGLDRLEIGSDDSADTKSGGALAGSSLSAGRYIAEGVYLGFEQGLSPNSGAVNIEVEVYPRVTVEGNIGQDNNSALGLNYKFDY